MADMNETRDSDADQDEDALESQPSSAKSAGAKPSAAKVAPSKATPAKAQPIAKSVAVENDDEDEDEESDDEDASDEDGGDEDYRDASTRGVAKALGVDDEEDRDVDGEDDGPEAAVLNRAARRRDEAQKRRAARGLAKSSDKDDAAPARDAGPTLPRDKNARAKELLKRRQEASTTRGVQLDAGEMIQDSLARAGSATAKGLRQNIGFIATVIGLAAAGAIGYFVWTNHKDGAIAAASDDLMTGVEADRAPTQKEDKRTDEEKKNDPAPFYTSNDVRTDTALAAYKKVIDEHGDSGPAILAKLGQGGVFLEKAQFDKAIDSFNQVASSSLANAELDVKARATEGLGLAREGKGDVDGATQSYKDLEGIKGYEDLAKYHQARMLMKKGKTDEAKEALLALRKVIEIPAEGALTPPNKFLTEAVNELLGSIDPSLSRKPTAMAGMRGDSMNEEEQADARSRAIEAFKRQIQQQQKEHPGSPIEMPKLPGEDQE